MLQHTSVLATLVRLVDQVPWPPEPTTRLRRRPTTDAERLMVKA
jgi:hypothetical protein